MDKAQPGRPHGDLLDHGSATTIKPITPMSFSLVLQSTAHGGTSLSVTTDKETPTDLLNTPSKLRKNGNSSSQKRMTMTMRKKKSEETL